LRDLMRPHKMRRPSGGTPGHWVRLGRWLAKAARYWVCSAAAIAV